MINLGPGPQDCVGNCENVSGINGTKGRFLGRVSRVCADTSNGVILRKIERSREVRSYADVARENIGRLTEYMIVYRKRVLYD